MRAPISEEIRVKVREDIKKLKEFIKQRELNNRTDHQRASDVYKLQKEKSLILESIPLVIELRQRVLDLESEIRIYQKLFQDGK